MLLQCFRAEPKVKKKRVAAGSPHFCLSQSHCEHSPEELHMIRSWLQSISLNIEDQRPQRVAQTRCQGLPRYPGGTTAIIPVSGPLRSRMTCSNSSEVKRDQTRPAILKGRPSPRDTEVTCHHQWRWRRAAVWLLLWTNRGSPAPLH